MLFRFLAAAEVDRQKHGSIYIGSSKVFSSNTLLDGHVKYGKIPVQHVLEAVSHLFGYFCCCLFVEDTPSLWFLQKHLPRCLLEVLFQEQNGRTSFRLNEFVGNCWVEKGQPNNPPRCGSDASHASKIMCGDAAQIL